MIYDYQETNDSGSVDRLGDSHAAIRKPEQLVRTCRIASATKSPTKKNRSQTTEAASVEQAEAQERRFAARRARAAEGL